MQSPLRRRLVALAIFVLAGAIGMAEVLTPLPPEPAPSMHSAAAEPERIPARRAQVSPYPSPIRQALYSASASGRPLMRVASAQVNEPRAVPRESTAPPERSQSASVSLPPAHREIAADGLPASGLRCTYDGGGIHCGDCRLDSDCPAGKGCVANRETRRLECMESECEENMHCFPGLVCRRASRGDTGPIIRRCVPVGQRRQGEPCDSLFVSPAGACQEGLVCHRGVCGVPCRLGDAASCPKGLTCEDGYDGAVCFPDCRAQGCPAGQQCKHLNDGDYQCLAQVHGECPETPCAQGERCNMRVSRGRGVFWCAPLCNPLQPDSCPKDQLCGHAGGTSSTCYRRCDPMDLGSCGEGARCSTVSEDMTLWGCVPTVPARP